MGKPHAEAIFTSSAGENMNTPTADDLFNLFKIVMSGSFFHVAIITKMVS